jgi:tetratricopeptide (TPR) repeat protein
MPPVIEPPGQPDPASPSSAAIHALVEGLRVGPLPTDAPSVGPMTLLDRGNIIDRYVILAHLGHGGMGVVYAAYDPELDRKVAIKLLLPQRAGGFDDAGRARLLREAQALARLTHPNVVAIYDVGMHDERVWIAMEFVAGQTLRVWAAEKPRGWPEILRVLTDVARGVAAAHAAGLVHRDLKPDNVMIDSKGGVRVMDFGLAHGRAPVADNDELSSTLDFEVEAQPETAALALRLTKAGALNGTPAYMAPEQWQGQEASTAADQFGWSVMAWELLFGERPFTGDTLDELAARVMSGRRRPLPRGRRVPGWLRRMVERGLAPQASLRWPTMAALLAALERGRTRARVKTAAAVLMGVAVIGASAEGYRRWAEAQQVAACEAEGASIAEVWNEEVQAKLRDGLLATGVSYAGMTATNVMPYFAAQAEAWREARTEVCLDTRVRGTWDEDMLDRSVWCLDERRMQLEALVAELSTADATSLPKAVVAAAGLSQMGPCQDAHRLERLPPIPPDRESVQAVRRTLSRSGALHAAGKYKVGLAVAREALAAAEELGWPPLTAAARFRSGDSLEDSGKYPEAAAILEDAYFQAAKVGALEVAADAAVELTLTVGDRQARHDEGFRWSRHADVVLSVLGVGEDSLQRATYLGSLASVQRSAGAYEEAKELDERALDISEKALGPDHPNVATSLNNLAIVHESMGAYKDAKALGERALAIYEKAMGPDHPLVAISLLSLANVHKSMGAYKEAKELYERALAISEKALGPDHPNIAAYVNNLAVVHEFTGAYEEAKALHERALTISEKALGPDHPSVAFSLNNLAYVLESTGAHEEAKALYERALAIREKALGPNHPLVADSLGGLANIHTFTGGYKEAKALHERALAIREKTLGPDHPYFADSLYNLADVYDSAGAYEEAKVLYQRALTIYEKALAPSHPDIAYPLTGLASVALLQRQPADAIKLAERAIHVREAGNAPTEMLAESRFVLAQALWAAPAGQGRDRDRALTLARHARDVFREVKGTNKELAEVEAFLAKHGGEP